MRRFAYGFAYLLVLAGILAAGLGCSDESSNRSVLQIVSINDNDPLQSDVVTVNNDGTLSIFEDTVTLEVRSEAHDSVLDLQADGPYGYITLDRYVIEFESREQIDPVEGALGWTVYTGQEASGSIVIVPASWKTRVPLVGLQNGGEIISQAKITFYGREATSDYEVKATASLPVNFANWAD